ncbi:DUF4226 domain-containing protein [Mycobacteroides chelonae]|uniref:DUF4226 domain-containing protein n=1 Tax=Mycobacteroides chelonae TaxID=1774 RepID=UPI002231BFDD|nr:DUF4226 domain-containing protein [Mycobacteroides chelonae]
MTLTPGLQIPGLVLNTASAAWDLFGSDDDTPRGEVTYRGGGGRFGDAPGHEGTAADAEQEAAKKLSERTETLKSLDAQLKAIGDQIIDGNSEKKKRIEAIAGEIQKEMKYLESSQDSSVAKVQAVNDFLSEKSGEIAKIITEAADEAAQNRLLLGQLGAEYGSDYGSDEYGGGDYGGGDYGGSGGGGDYGGGGAGGGDGSGYYEGDYAEDPYGSDMGSQFSDALGQAIPAVTSAGQGLASGLTSPLSGLSDLGSMVGSAMRGNGDERSHADEDSERRERDKSEDSDGKDDKAKDDTKDDKAKDDTKDDKAKDDPKGQQPGAEPSGPAPAPPPAPTVVTLPNGQPATAANSAVGAAARAVLNGATIEDGYKAAGIGLPALGSPLKDTIAPASANVGDLAVFKDKYEMLLGDKKVYLDGQMQDMSALGKLTGFMGFIKAPASSTPNVPGAAAPAGTAAGITPAQLSADPTAAM